MYDQPTQAKLDQADGVHSVATAQPVVYGQTYAQPAYAQPQAVYAQQPQMYVQQAGIQPQGVIANNYPRRPNPQRWADSICDWPKNLFPSCYCACCFFQGIYIVAQSKFYKQLSLLFMEY